MFSIYRIRNVKTGKVYIGQTAKPIEKRLVEHIYKKSAVGVDIRENGILNFVVDTIATTKTREEAYVLEKKWVERYKGNSYNIMPGGENDKSYMHMLKNLPRKNHGKRHKTKHYKYGDDISHLRGKKRQRALKEIEESQYSLTYSFAGTSVTLYKSNKNALYSTHM